MVVVRDSIGFHLQLIELLLLLLQVPHQPLPENHRMRTPKSHETNQILRYVYTHELRQKKPKKSSAKDAY